MGAVCCVASRDRTIQHGSSGEIPHRNFRHSPSWSLRWDNRVGAAGEESSIGGLSDVTRRSDVLDFKSATDVSAHVSDGGSSFEKYRMDALRKSPLNHERNKNLRTSASGHAIARNPSLKVEQSTKFPQASDAPAVKLSPSLSMSPLFAQSHQLFKQGSDSHSSGRNSPSMNPTLEDGQTPHKIPATSNDSTAASYARSSSGWSTHSSSQVMSYSQMERPLFCSDSCSFNIDNLSGASSRNSGSISMDFQTCQICTNLLTDKSAWSTQKIVTGNELSVVAILACGHVYHAECLEVVTPEFNKYDPACPICTFGEKETLKLSGKMLTAERDLKARFDKNSRSQVTDTVESVDFDNWKSDSHEGGSARLITSSSLKISSARPLLRRHFSFGSRSSRFASDSPSVRKKGLFWKKSSRE